MSKKSNIDTAEKAEANGVAIQFFSPDIGAFLATGLSSNTTYFFNVIVRDEANNKAAYTMTSTTTSDTPETQKKTEAPKVESVPTVVASPDLIPPVPGGSKTIKISNVSANGLTLTWPPASDNVTPNASLEYEVRQSPRKNINTVAEAEANGSILLPYGANTTVFDVVGLQSASGYYFNVIVKDAAGNKSVYITTSDVSKPYSFVDRGGESMASTIPVTLPLNVGYVRVSPAVSSAVPAGLAIIRTTRSDGAFYETGVALSEETLSGSAYVELTGSNVAGNAIVTRITLANSSSQDALVSFHFINEVGVQVRSGVFTLPANLQITQLMDQSPFEAPASFRGTFTFNSSIPISAAAMRGVRSAKGELALANLPIFAGRSSGPVIPFFAAGGGLGTEVVLMNPSTTTQTGSVQFLGSGSATTAAALLTLTVNGVSSSTFNYSVPPRSVIRLQAETDGSEVVTGSVRILADAAGSPDAFAVLTYQVNGVAASESTVAATSTGTAFRSYVESKLDKDGVIGGVRVANASTVSNVLNFEFVGFDGVPRGVGASVTLAPGSVITRWAHELFPELPNPSRGYLRVTSSAPIAVTGMRAGYNQSAGLLPTFLPSWNDDSSPLLGTSVFPLIVAGGGYNTELILFGLAGRSGEGKLLFITQDGVPVPGTSLGFAP